VPRPDEFTALVQSAADVWRNTTGLTDREAAQLVRQDGIDILVDLTMHMRRTHLLLFARKPAPIQVTWLAYPGTTGLSAIDYRFTDPYLDPPGLFDQYYSEKSIRLPDTFWCYDPLKPDPFVQPLPAAQNGYITFGSLNNFCKTNATTFRLWAQVLRVVANSRLVVLADEGQHRERTLSVFEQEGIARERIEFVPRQSRHKYLETYHRIDIGLDSIPYNGHTTSLDAYWMGVPVVTLVGNTVVGRAGLSQLTNLGLVELIGHTPEQFVAIAGNLASDISRLSHLRNTLRPRLQTSPLMDAPRFARNIEAAYRRMWQSWCGR
jgi:protein O-GlcNAc transferase